MRDDADRLRAGLTASFADLFGRLDGARLEQRAGYRLMVCPSMRFPGLHGLWLDGPDEAIGAGEVEAAIAEVEAVAVPAWIESRAGTVPGAERAARRAGFTVEDSMPGMVIRPDELVPVAGSGVEVLRVLDRDRMVVAEGVAEAGFEVPPGTVAGLFGPNLAASPGFRFYLAEVDGIPVSTATAWHGDGGVGIFNVATPPAHRGRGYGRAVTTRAVQDAFDAGADLAWLQASPLGEPVYRAMGFRVVETYLVLSRPVARHP